MKRYNVHFKPLNQLKGEETTKVSFVFDSVDDPYYNKSTRLAPAEAVVSTRKDEIYIHAMPAIGCLVCFDSGKYDNGRGALIKEAVDAVEVIDYRITQRVDGIFYQSKDGRKRPTLTLRQIVHVRYKRS